MHSRFMQSLLLVFITGFCYGQSWTISGRVLDSKNNQALPFVNITVAGMPYGTSSDLDGYFELKLDQDQADLEFSFIGYQKKLLPFSKDSQMPVTIRLTEKVDQLAEVTVFPGLNPAHRIIKNAVSNRSVNNPENLPGFSYETYGKFVVTINTDSLDTSLDTLELKDREGRDSLAIDSTNYQLNEFVEKQHLLFMETVTKRVYLKGKRDNEEVIASRMSGFKNPFFALINTQMQSFSFYDDYISIAGQEVLNPITPGSTARYFFLLRDTLYNNPEDTVFVISFRPKPNYGFEPMQGVLYINSSNWAIQNVIARPVETEGVQIEIEQKYKRLDERTWFPEQLNARIRFSNVGLQGAAPEATVRTYIQDVTIGESIKPKDISRALVTVADDARENADDLLVKYRRDSLDLREERTYQFMDSISEAENLERGLDILISIAQGRIPLGKVDLILDRLIISNRYEGFRPGLEFRTNNRFSNWLQFGAYSGYGFKDMVWKYDLYTNITLNKHTNTKLIFGHRRDVLEAARQEFIQQPYRGFWQNSFREFFINQVDQITRSYAGLTWDPLGNLGFKAMLHRETREFKKDYNYIPTDVTEGLGNQFNITEAVFSMRYAPKEEFVEAPGYGRVRLEQQFPIFYFQYTRGINGVLDGNLEYNKFDLLLHHQKNTLFLGNLDLVMVGGLVLEEVPYSKMYTGMSNMLNRDSWWDRMQLIADRYSFETMRFNEFAYDRYIQLMFRQNFKTLLFRRDWIAPQIELVARGLWGDLASNAIHEGLTFKVPNKVYYEGGLELNNLINSGTSGFGLGFYYRFGPYSLPTFEENFAVKLSFSFSF